MTKKKGKPTETLEELQKKREDIETLLASIEEAYSEGTMPEPQYQEVKEQNEAKLSEINEKMDKAAAEGPPPTPEGGAPKEGGEAAPEAPPPEAPPPEAQPPEAAAPAVPKEAPAQSPAPEAAPPTAAPASGTMIPTTVELPEELKEMIKEIKEGRGGGTDPETMKRLEQLEVEIEKVKSFVDAMKDERSGQDERFQRISEEVGEMRSNVNDVDGRLGEVEIKADESSDIVKNIKPQRITKQLEERDTDIISIKTRIEKTEDVVSNTLKRVGQIRTMLQSLGSIDNLASMSKDIAKKIILIDDKVKKTDRISERIDTVFGELNKRLEEFMFYKAKQQSLDEMSHDLMRNIEELTTKLDGYAQKNDLNTLKDILMSKIDEAKIAGPVAAAPVPLTGPGAEIQKQIDELNELDNMLEEQKKSGTLKEKEYKKTKDANKKKKDDLQKKLLQITGTPSPEPTAPAIPEQPAVPATEPMAPSTPETPTEVPEGEPTTPSIPEQPATTEASTPPEPVPETTPVETAPAAEAGLNAPAIPETPTESPLPEPTGPEKELTKEETPFGEMYKLEEKATSEAPEVKPIEEPKPAEPAPEPTAPAIPAPAGDMNAAAIPEQPATTEASTPPEPVPETTAEEPKPEEAEPKPEETKETKEEPEKEEKTKTEPAPKETTKPSGKQERMLAHLEESFRSGLISERAYSKTRKKLEALNN